MSQGHVCVVGAGVIGLSVAKRFLEAAPDVKVTVMSDNFSPNTTGDGAGGFWQPYMMENTSIDKLRQWGSETFAHLQNIAQSPEASEAGVFFTSGYDIYHQRVEDPFWRDMVVGFRQMEEVELRQFPGYSYGFAWTTIVAEGRKYIPWLMQSCSALGAQFAQRRVGDINELGGYDVVVNCTGLGARQLARDDLVEPIKGQVIRAKAPWIKFFLNADEDDLYMLLGSDNIVLGGTHVNGEWSTDVDACQSKRIWEGMSRLVPSLQRAEKVSEWAGLRPGRPSVRLEKQLINGPKPIQVVHNYGHGGGGITLHWGCAGEAVNLVLQSLQPKHKL